MKLERDLWEGFRCFESPTEVLSYRGEIPAVLLMNLFMRAAVVSMKATLPYKIRFTVRENKLAQKLHTSLPTIRNAYRQLERDRLVKRERVRDQFSKQWQATKVSVCNPTTANTLLASTSRIDNLLAANGVTGFSVPLDCLRATINRLETPAARAVYISALFLAHSFKCERLTVSKAYWCRVSKLSRKAFNRGLQICKRKRLLSYRGETLTLNDPETGKPSERRPVSMPMPLDFRDITSKGWEEICCHLLGGSFEPGRKGWTRTTADRICPYCGSAKGFAIHFEWQRFHCFNCGEKNGLGFLVKHVLGADRMYDASLYCERVLKHAPEIQEKAEEVEVTV